MLGDSYTMFWYQKKLTDSRAKKLAKLKLEKLDLIEIEDLTKSQSRYLSQFQWNEIDLSWLESITDEQAYFLSWFKWDKLVLSWLKAITDTQAYYLAQFQWNELILNWLKRISVVQARCLSYFGWEFLNLWWITSLTVIKTKYLSEFWWNKLYLDRVTDITTWWLKSFLSFWWKILHIWWIQFNWKEAITHLRELTDWQVEMIAYFRWSTVVFTNLVDLTEKQRKKLKYGIYKEYKFSNYSLSMWQWDIVNGRTNNNVETNNLEEESNNVVKKKVVKKIIIQEPKANVRVDEWGKYNSLIDKHLKREKNKFHLSDKQEKTVWKLFMWIIYAIFVFATIFFWYKLLFEEDMNGIWLGVIGALLIAIIYNSVVNTVKNQ